MDYEKILKKTTAEISAFSKKNSKNFQVLGDLLVARDGCSTPDAKIMINSLIFPLEKTIAKEIKTFNDKMNKLWKVKKGESVPSDTQKKLDTTLKKGADKLGRDTKGKFKHNSDLGHKDWIMPLSFGSSVHQPGA